MTEYVQVKWFECNCDWISKYCEEYHQRRAWVEKSGLDRLVLQSDQKRKGA